MKLYDNKVDGEKIKWAFRWIINLLLFLLSINTWIDSRPHVADIMQQQMKVYLVDGIFTITLLVIVLCLHSMHFSYLDLVQAMCWRNTLLRTWQLYCPMKIFLLSQVFYPENFRQLQQKLPVFTQIFCNSSKFAWKVQRFCDRHWMALNFYKKSFIEQISDQKCASVNTFFVPACNQTPHNFTIHSVKYGN